MATLRVFYDKWVVSSSLEDDQGDGSESDLERR